VRTRNLLHLTGDLVVRTQAVSARARVKTHLPQDTASHGGHRFESRHLVDCLARSATRAKTGVVQTPETYYAKSGDVHIAYQVVGEAPLDLVYIPNGPHHIELNWENPPVARFLERLASVPRLIAFDKRGTGMSDLVVGIPTLETRMDDVRAVMDAADSERAVLFAVGDAGPLCAL
jgi:uncharacterized RmlC-like cupin family protein